jgi:hypothetical protein
MKDEWFKIKKYPHIGLPITMKDRDKVIKYVKNQNKIKEHNFLPLLHKTLLKRKFRVDTANPKRNPSGKKRRLHYSPKERHLHYASHLDAQVFSYYNFLLSNKYEEILKVSNFNESVVAYRKIPIEEGSKKNKCNIDFAKSSFEFIKNNSDKKLTVIIADVTEFFPSLDHKILKKQWYKVLNKKQLPDDHYNIFKALTKLRYVEEDQLFETYKEIAIKSSAYLKEKNAVAYCDAKDFYKNNLNLIITEKKSKGIPQGSPISATLANIYMLEFDQVIYDDINSKGGFYQRYSDDLIIVCNQEHEDEVIQNLRKQITNLVNLEIQPDKTKVYRFEHRDGVLKGFQIDEISKVENQNKVLEYLGFSYDGRKVLIKTAGFSKFYRSMKRSFKKATSLTLHSKNPDKSLFKSKLYKRFTHRGAKRRLIYQQSPSDPNKYIKTKKFDWGNYISYVNKANAAMMSLNGSNAIKKQSSKFWNKFHMLLNFHQTRIDDKFNDI